MEVSPALGYIWAPYHMNPYGRRMIGAVLFDLDETLLDRSTSLRAFLADQWKRFALRLGKTSFDEWRDRFLALDRRGQVNKKIVYAALLAEFGGYAYVRGRLAK